MFNTGVTTLDLVPSLNPYGKPSGTVGVVGINAVPHLDQLQQDACAGVLRTGQNRGDIKARIMTRILILNRTLILNVDNLGAMMARLAWV